MMSERELNRVEVLAQVDDGLLSTEPTARNRLGYRTPAEVFQSQVMEIQNRLE